MWRHLAFSVLVTLCVGCGTEAVQSRRLAREASSASDMGRDASLSTAGIQGEAANADDSGANGAAFENRKIIYTASLSIVVDDFSSVDQAVADLVKQTGGFVASASVSLNQGSQRSGTWVVRVPVASFDAFQNAVGNLGVPEQREQNGQDVTEEFIDLEARIASKKKLEERILELLADNEGAIEDVIAVERELSRVRTEIEQMEGRLRYLADRAELTTLTLHIREEKNYTPPQAPALVSRLASAWNASIDALKTAAIHLLLAIVAMAPWLLVAGAVVAPFWVWRRGRRRAQHTE